MDAVVSGTLGKATSGLGVVARLPSPDKSFSVVKPITLQGEQLQFDGGERRPEFMQQILHAIHLGVDAVHVHENEFILLLGHRLLPAVMCGRTHRTVVGIMAGRRAGRNHPLERAG